jgi:GNAT superfamily N-acetyltransferase
MRRTITVAGRDLLLRDLEPTDEAGVLALLDSCTDWYERQVGTLPSPGDVQSLYYVLPDGAAWEDKRLLVLTYQDTVIALVDLVRGWPEATDCTIGAFLVHADYQRLGVGGALARDLLRLAALDGVRRVRTQVPTDWRPGAGFLRALGFTIDTDATADGRTHHAELTLPG